MRHSHIIKRHIRNRSTNQIAGNSLFSSEMILIIRIISPMEYISAEKMFREYFLREHFYVGIVERKNSKIRYLSNFWDVLRISVRAVTRSEKAPTD